MSVPKTNFKSAFIAVTSLFFMWGLITVMVDALIPRLKDVFELDLWQASLVQFAWFMAYGLVSIPAGIMLGKTGYKKGILIGLSLAGVGCAMFYPAAELREFWLFLMSLFVLASGITVLQVAANPYVAVLGNPEKAASRLNLAQAFNSLGTTIAPILSASYLLSDTILTGSQVAKLDGVAKDAYYATEAGAVQNPFLVLGGAFFLLALILAAVSLPKILGERKVSFGSFNGVLKDRRLMFGALGIFVYVGAEVSIGSFLVNYFQDLHIAELVASNDSLRGLVSFLSETFSGKTFSELDPKGVVATFGIFYWGSAMIGRFIGAKLTSIVRPGKILMLFAFGAISMTALSLLNDGLLAMCFILLVGLFNSVMFPTIFTMALENLKDDKPQGSGILCTAIVGGAVIPLLVGAWRDASGDDLSFTLAFILPILCYLYIAWYANKFKLKKA
ncbi:MAG: FHS family L-fucose permease-like MFS transporter [Flavobacteriales bacterium]|jgi:FHS family L-fucose permease-like MFS transporter